MRLGPWYEHSNSPKPWCISPCYQILPANMYGNMSISTICHVYDMPKSEPSPPETWGTKMSWIDLTWLVFKSRGGTEAWKMYTPARTASRNPYPHWHKICETLPLLAQNLGPNLYPYWHNCIKKATLCGPTIVEKWLISTIVGQFCTMFAILHLPWYNHWKNHTLSGTHLEFKTLPLEAHCLRTLPFVALKLAKMAPYPS